MMKRNDETTWLQIGDTLAMPYPPLEHRHHYNLGEHRLVKAWPTQDAEDPEWMCFDHGWECWLSKLANEEGPTP